MSNEIRERSTKGNKTVPFTRQIGNKSTRPSNSKLVDYKRGTWQGNEEFRKYFQNGDPWCSSSIYCDHEKVFKNALWSMRRKVLNWRGQIQHWSHYHTSLTCIKTIRSLYAIHWKLLPASVPRGTGGITITSWRLMPIENKTVHRCYDPNAIWFRSKKN